MRFTSTQLNKSNMVDNNQGTLASYSTSPEIELVKMALTSFVDKSYYEGMDDKLTRLRECCSKVDKDFVIKLATWARGKGLRTVNQIMIMETLSHPDFVNYFQKLVQRPDEIIDMLGYYVMINGQNAKNIKLSNKLKKAIKIKMQSFTEYQLGKYKGKGDVISLYDVVNLTHPKSEAINKLMKGSLVTPSTWEVELSKNGNNKKSWEKLLNNNSLGALAFVRNLRNIINAGIDDETISSYLEKIDFSKVFPFQLIQATDVCDREIGLSNYPELLNIIQIKIGESFEKYKHLFKGKVAVAVDDSGSMDNRINDRSSLDRDKLAMYYGIGLAEQGADLFVWNTSIRKIYLDEFSIDKFRADGGGTDVNCVINGLRGKGYDTLFIITDEQSQFSMQQSDIKNIIVWNLADYKHSIVPTYDKGYTYLTGFNDAQFELVEDLRDMSKLIDSINKISL